MPDERQASTPDCYWQASHSSKPGSPGRIMHTGPSASGAASIAAAGAAAAACRPPDEAAPPPTPKPPPAPPAPPEPSPPPEDTAFSAPCATVDFSTCVAAIVRR